MVLLQWKLSEKSFKTFCLQKRNEELVQHLYFFCSTNKPFFPNTHDELLICNQNLIDRKLCKPHYFHHKFGKVREDINIVIKWDRLSGKESVARMPCNGFLKRSRSLNDLLERRKDGSTVITSYCTMLTLNVMWWIMRNFYHHNTFEFYGFWHLLYEKLRTLIL